MTDFTYDLANLSLVWHSRNTEVGLRPDIYKSDPFEPEHSISVGAYRLTERGLIPLAFSDFFPKDK